MANAAPNSESWRQFMSRDDRIKVCIHIFGKLTGKLLHLRPVFLLHCLQAFFLTFFVSFALSRSRMRVVAYDMVSEQLLREKTSAFEARAFANSESRTDYLKRIAGGLSNVERQKQMDMAAPGHVAHPQTAAAVAALDEAAGVQVVGSEQSLEQQREEARKHISALGLFNTSTKSSSTADDNRVGDNLVNTSSNDGGWRLFMSREDRIKVCQHIMGKLASKFTTSFAWAYVYAVLYCCFNSFVSFPINCNCTHVATTIRCRSKPFARKLALSNHKRIRMRQVERTI